MESIGDHFELGKELKELYSVDAILLPGNNSVSLEKWSNRETILLSTVGNEVVEFSFY